MRPSVWLATIACLSAGYCACSTAADHIGVYFDINANLYCIDPEEGDPYTAFVTIVDPSSPEILGAEFRFYAQGTGMGSFFLGSEWLAETTATADLDVGRTTGFQAVFTSPYVAGGSVAPIFAAHFFIAWGSTRDFYLGPIATPSIANGLPAYIGTGGAVIPLNATSGGFSRPVASVGGSCRTVSEETATFGALKSLFR